MKKIVALIPLREGSKSIPLKNIKIIANKPLCFWVLEAALGAKYINEVYVSTESEHFKKIINAEFPTVKILDRPKELASDHSSTESVLLHFMEHIEFSHLITIQATSPLLQSKHLNESLLQFEREKLDSLFSGVRIKRFFWTDHCTPINYDYLRRPRRQDFNGTVMENGAFYITKKEILERNHCRLGGRIGFYEMPKECALEIDEPEDWEMISKQLKELNNDYSA